MSTNGRTDAVFIRKSTTTQDLEAQKKNVALMLQKLGVRVPESHWFESTVPRAKVKGEAEFRRLIALVEADKVGTVYIESQDRFGTGNVAELFTFLGLLAAHGTRLYDLRENADLTCKDDSTEMRAFLGGIKSKTERKNISYRSLRSRINNFKDRGAWPNGPHPFGYAKQCLSEDGHLLWEWHPVSRVQGQIFYPDAKGDLQPGLKDQRIPRKDKKHRNFLVPNRNPQYVETVELIFDLYTRGGLSRRAISARLNAEGRKFYSHEFSHTYVTQILTNPAYVGDTHFGKTIGGELHTFDGEGVVVAVDRPAGAVARAESERIIMKDTHEGLISRKTWRLAQEKFKRESDRKSYPARNPDYYLKPLLVCGHCGKNMTGRTEIDPSTGERRIVYFCATYISGRINGVAGGCGAHRITHAAAEQLIFAKVAEDQLPFDAVASEKARSQVSAALANLEYETDAARLEWWEWVEEGVEALVTYIGETYNVPAAALAALRTQGRYFYRWGRRPQRRANDGPLKWQQFREAVERAEAQVVDQARQTVAQLSAERKHLTLQWGKASPAMQDDLREEIDRLQDEIDMWELRTQPLTERIKLLQDADIVRKRECDKLIEEWPAMVSREKAEALRQLFHTVTLYWEATFVPAAANPTRPLKTNRPGRYRYRLQEDRTVWALANPNVAGDV